MYLRLMAHWGLYEGVLMLLDAKADPNAKDADDDGHTAMHKTAWCNGPLVVDIIEALVKAGGDVNVLDKRRRMPLYYAAMFSRFDAMRTLLKKGANIDGGTTVDTSPLRCAASEGNCEVVKFLHEEGASFGPGIVHHVAGASFSDTGDVMRYVLKHSDQEIDLLDMNDHTPLQVALQICNDGNVHALLDAGAERVKPAGDVDDQLMHVIRFGPRGCVNIVRYLVDAGCDVNGCDRAGCPTVFHAVAQNDIEVVRLLVELGADFNKSDKYDMSPLAKAIRNQNNAMASFLLDQGANVHEIDDEGRSLVHHAVSVNAQYILDLLLMRGVDPNIVSQDGMSALHYAVHDGNEACVRTLLFYGAEPNAKDKFGLHPLNWAIKCSATDRFDLTYHRQRMFAIIEEAGGTFAPGTCESTMFKYKEL
jgi:ankyrin repeat protein